MDLEILKTFQKVAEVKSLQKAANDLFLSQSSVINRIRIFEKDLGFKLFYRSGRRLELTSEGNHMLKYVKKTLSILDEGKKQLKNMPTTLDYIELASIPIVASYIIPKYLKQFNTAYPNIEFYVQTDSSTSIIEWVINGKVELGFIRGPIFYKGIKSLTICSDPIVLVVHKNHPWTKKEYVTPNDFKHETLLPLNRQSYFWTNISKWFEENNVHPNIGMEFDHWEAIKQMIYQNAGVGFIPSAVIGDSEANNFVKIVPLKPSLDIYLETLLICQNKSSLSTNSQLFWDFIFYHVNGV